MSFNFLASVTVHSDLGPKKIKSIIASTFSPYICHEAIYFPALTIVPGPELVHKEDWTEHPSKNWCFQTVVLEKTLESHLDSKEIKPMSPKGNQPWLFIGRTATEVEAPVIWPPYAKSQLIGKDPDAGKHWGQEEKGMIQDEMAGWHHQLSGQTQFEQTPGDSEGQGSLACCSSWGRKESDMTEQQQRLLYFWNLIC